MPIRLRDYLEDHEYLERAYAAYLADLSDGAANRGKLAPRFR